jgi:(2Fe-2S) ferredoxin
MPAFTHHIFVCCNQRPPESGRGCCDPGGGQALRSRFKEEIQRRGLGPLVRANQAGCLDQCELGPTVVIYPQGIWYGGVQLEDVPRIIEETIVGGRILADLALDERQLNCRKAAPRAEGASPRAEGPQAPPDSPRSASFPRDGNP